MSLNLKKKKNFIFLMFVGRKWPAGRVIETPVVEDMFDYF